MVSSRISISNKGNIGSMGIKVVANRHITAVSDKKIMKKKIDRNRQGLV